MGRITALLSAQKQIFRYFETLTIKSYPHFANSNLPLNIRVALRSRHQDSLEANDSTRNEKIVNFHFLVHVVAIVTVIQSAKLDGTIDDILNSPVFEAKLHTKLEEKAAALQKIISENNLLKSENGRLRQEINHSAQHLREIVELPQEKVSPTT